VVVKKNKGYVVDNVVRWGVALEKRKRKIGSSSEEEDWLRR